MADFDTKPLSKISAYALQILFAVSISVGSQSLGFDNASEWLGTVARYIVYLYIIRGSREGVALAHQALRTRSADAGRVWRAHRGHWLLFGASAFALVYTKQRIFAEDFLLLFIGYLVTQYPDVEKQTRTVTYGTGMACSYFEGYLTHVIPSDGHKFVGFEENIIAYEGDQSIRFPVRRLFIVITRTMYCPPDMKLLDPRIEGCRSLEPVQKDVAGVRGRSYKNSAYKIHRAPPRRPVYLAVECATPIHTLYRVLKNRDLYQELDGIDEAEVVSDFISMLTAIIANSPECRGKCEIVYFDNTDPAASLAEVLLERVARIEPRFEEIIEQDAATR